MNIIILKFDSQIIGQENLTAENIRIWFSNRLNRNDITVDSKPVIVDNKIMAVSHFKLDQEEINNIHRFVEPKSKRYNLELLINQ